MNPDMTCNGFKFEIGKTYEITNDKPLKTCTDSGFHFSINLDDVFNHYSFKKCRLFEVEALDDVVTDGNKSVTKKLKIIRELTQEDLNNHKFADSRYDLWFKDRTDEELLVYKDDDDYEIQVIVVQKLKNQDLMFNTFKNNKKGIVRKAVIDRMSDSNLMHKTFKNDPDGSVRLALVKRMEDLDLMFNTFKNDSEWIIRGIVVNRMTDLNLMYQTFKDDESLIVRLAVVERMGDLDLMYETFKDDLDSDVRKIVKRLMNNID